MSCHRLVFQHKQVEIARSFDQISIYLNQAYMLDVNMPAFS